MIKLLFVSCMFFLSPWLNTQEDEIRQTVEATLKHISGPAGGEYNWDDFQSLFLEEAILIGFGYTVGSETPQKFQFTIEEFIERVSPTYEKIDFYERSTSTEVKVMGNIAQVWQHYATFGKDMEPLETGVNSYQLVKENGEWKIAHLSWDSNRD